MNEVQKGSRPLWLQRAAHSIGIDWLEFAIAPVSGLGRRRRASEELYRPGDEAAARDAIARVFEAAQRIDRELLESLRRSIASCPDPRTVLARASAGDSLADADFFELLRFLDTVENLRSQTKSALFAEVGLSGGPNPLRAILAPGRTSSHAFYLSDVFDDDLALARADAAWRQVACDAARSRLFERVAMYAGIAQVRDGEFILMRDRMRGPLPPEVRVLREAPTYLLCDVPLDEEALAAVTALDAVKRLVADLERGVRDRLCAEVRKHAAAVEAEAAAVGALDSFLARVRFAMDHATCVPDIVERPTLHVEDGRYLPMSTILAERGISYVPVTLRLDGVGVLMGSNMGGKTNLLRACGFMAVCVALGVPVPARNARLSLFDEIAWIGMHREPEAASLLSSFGVEIIALQGLLERGASRTLVLIDEFARMTAHREEEAFLFALTAHLQEHGAIALAATRLAAFSPGAGIAVYAVAGPTRAGMLGAQTAELQERLERIAGAMDYRVVQIDQALVPSSDALALAEALGLDKRLIEQARSRS